MGLPKESPYFTPREYLRLERVSEIRHEYLDGFVYAMAGESPEHSIICFNLSVAVGTRIIDKSCRGFSPNMKVRTSPEDLYSYPDFAIVYEAPVYHDEHRDVLLNPNVIFEVLSPSTASYDRKGKFERYKTIESLTDYVLIAQSEPFIEHFSKQQDNWPKVEVSGRLGELYIASINCRIPLEEIYRNIVFQET